MPLNSPSTQARLTFAAWALLAEALHLAWEALHGGIASHHLLQRADLPAFSNAWGLLLLPMLGAWAGGRWPGPGSAASERRRVARALALGLAVPLLLGLALSLSFRWEMHEATELIFFSLPALALLLPAQRPECLLGFVLGMNWAFGAVLPTLIGGVILALSWLVRRLAGWAWRTARPA